MLFLYLKGRLDNNNAQSLEDNLMKLIDDGARQLIIDCSQIEYINNAGLRVLLNVARRILNVDGRIALHSLSQPAKEMFDKTGFSMASRIYDTREEAIAGIAASGLLSSSRERRRNKNK
jgi:anti-anti-sigma factor